MSQSKNNVGTHLKWVICHRTHVLTASTSMLLEAHDIPAHTFVYKIISRVSNTHVKKQQLEEVKSSIANNDPAPSIHWGENRDTGGHNNTREEEIHGVLMEKPLTSCSSRNQVRNARRSNNRLFPAGILISHRCGRPMAVLVRGACAGEFRWSISFSPPCFLQFTLHTGKKTRERIVDVITTQTHEGRFSMVERERDSATLAFFSGDLLLFLVPPLGLSCQSCSFYLLFGPFFCQ